jgi:hypothetical protein
MIQLITLEVTPLLEAPERLYGAAPRRAPADMPRDQDAARVRFEVEASGQDLARILAFLAVVKSEAQNVAHTPPPPEPAPLALSTSAWPIVETTGLAE